MLLSQFRLLLVAGVAAAALAATASPGAAKTLVYCSEGSPENFSPMINTTGTTFNASLPIYNRLIQFKDGTTDLVAGLAESWEISPDATVYTMHLRHGVKWQSNAAFKPTRDFDADDVLFSFNRQWKEDSPYHKISGGSYDYWGDMGMPKLIKSIEKVDANTVKITLTEPNAPFLADLAMDFATIMSAEYADVLMKAGHPEQIDQVPIGTGPFSFVAYQRDAAIRYRRFDEYWGARPSSMRWSFPSIRIRPSAWPSCVPMSARLPSTRCPAIYPASSRTPA